MKRLSRSVRPFARLRSILGLDKAPRTRAGRLAEAAGAGPLVEQLEHRQMLFSLTITPNMIDPFTGVGTVRAYFGYTLPHLTATVAPGTSAPEEREDDLSDDARGIVGSGRVLLGSAIQIQHTISPPTNLLIGGAVTPQGQPITETNFLFTRINAGQTLSFRTMEGPNAPLNQIVRGMSSFTVEILGVNGSQGLDLNNFRVELRLQGQLIDAFEGASGVGSLGETNQTNPGQGIGTFIFASSDVENPVFDEVRFIALAGPNAEFGMDNFSSIIVPGNNAEPVGARIFGAEVVFTGPIGASVQVFDLYGRDMRQTIRLGAPQGATTVPVDPDDDGIPNFNDGIGRIVLSGVDERSGLSIAGGRITNQVPAANAVFVEGTYSFISLPGPAGFYDDLQGTGGYGYRINPTDGIPTGLPPAGGSVIIGSPYTRPLGNYNPAGTPQSGFNFNFVQGNQGIFVNDGSNMGSLYIHGVLHGFSRFTGYVDRVFVSNMVGSLGVKGDLGQFIVGGDAGIWEVDADFNAPAGASAGTNSQLVVERTLGEMVVGGRNLMNVAVLGDLNSPLARPARDIMRYFERETTYQIDRNTPEGPRVTFRAVLAANDWLAQSDGGFGNFPVIGQAPVVANSFLRNDRILSAEWVGSIGTAVRIRGYLGGADPINGTADPVDLYAFASDGQQEIVIEVQSPIGVYARIVDDRGRTLASVTGDFRGTDLGLPGNFFETSGQRITFAPTGPGVYYLAISDPPVAADEAIDVTYTATIVGMAPTTVGAIRAGAQLGGTTTQNDSSIALQSGSVGSIRSGTGVVIGNGNEVDPIIAYNDNEESSDTRFEMMGVTVSVPGSLYNITAGGDIEGGGVVPTRFNIGGDLGNLVTGLSPVVGVNVNEGDVGNLTLNVGRRIGMLDIKGAIAVDQDAANPDLGIIGPFIVRTGVVAGANGDIGMIRVGEHVRAGFLEISTAPGSTIGAFLVGQDTPADVGGAFHGIYLGNGAVINTGQGSDIRFVDLPRFDITNSVESGFAIIGGQILNFVDDGGAHVSIQITNLAAGVQAGFVRVLPVDGSEGVAIARIDADLTGGRALVITGTGAAGDVISVGHINVTGADAGSAVRMLGPAEIDVWRITQTDEVDAFGDITNLTIGGDLVSADLQALTTLSLLGSLGSTQGPSYGPRVAAPVYALTRNAVGGLYGALGVTGFMNPEWGGGIYRPVQNTTVDGGDAFLSDIGVPFDWVLNGIIVRTGAITSVTVGGSVGDVITQGGDITLVVANADGVTPLNGFHGIVGTIYATGDVVEVRVGDGLARSAGGPMATTGIVASDDVITVTGPLTPGIRPVISSNIIASNQVLGDLQNGINSVTFTSGGAFVDAFMAAEQLDGFWTTFLGYGNEGGTIILGDIQSVGGLDVDTIRSVFRAGDAGNFVFDGGFWDASQMHMTGDIGLLSADRFFNSTLQGTDIEFRPNSVIGGGNLGTLTTTQGAGDINDLQVDLFGAVTGSITGRNISRSSIDADIRIASLAAGGDIRASRVTSGDLLSATAGANIHSSIFNISGAIVALSAADAIRNTTIRVSGPDGRIDAITARTLFSGFITASGPIGTVSVTQGDLEGTVNTTTDRGHVNTLTASRDIDLNTDISGTLTAVNAGRHIGDIGTRRTMLVRGDIGGINASNGQLYADVRIGQSLTGAAVIGRATHLPIGSDLGRGDITAFGRIATVRVLGDFGGRVISHSGGIGLVSINDGSLLPGALIAAYDGNINNVVINRGHLLGDIHADHILFAVNVNASADGVFGDIGVNPDLNPNTPVAGETGRNQLPPGVIANTPIQGPRITAGHNIGRITTSNGGVYEAFIYAGRAVGTLTFNGDVRNDNMTPGIGTVIASGSTMFRVNVAGSLFNTAILAGVTSFGSDNRPGGTGLARDSHQSGRIGTIDVGGHAANSFVTAGITSGQDGIYNNGDDLVTQGLSFVRNVLVGGVVDPGTVSVFSEFPMSAVAGGIVTGGLALGLANAELYPGGVPAGGVELPGSGAPISFTTAAGENGVLRFTGPGRAFWDAANNRVVLLNTKATSSLVVTAANGVLTDFDIVSNDEASMGTVSIAANLIGDSDVIVDNHIVSFQANNIGGSGEFTVGGNFRNFTTGNISGGEINARFVRTMTIVGSFGLPTASDELTARFLAAGDLNINGSNSGAILVDRDVFSFRVGGAMSRAIFRSGSDVGPVTIGSLSETRFSVRDTIGPIVVNGNVFDTSIMAGGDLGADGRPGGTGFDADAATTGRIVSVSIAGNFVESDIVAGLLRGPDGFFGTSDDSAAAGRADIGAVTIGGSVFGSNVFTEQYRISSTGTVGAVTAGGAPVANEGNFRSGPLETDPLAIRVTDLRVDQVGLIYSARIFFNQAMDFSTIVPALSVFEVRNSGNQLFRLTLGTDYTVEYDDVTDSAIVTFSRDITDRNLPVTSAAGPGVYRFVLDDAILRAAVIDARLDGNGNGQVGPGSDDYSFDTVVGDAGDKLVNNTVFTPNEPRVDFRAPIDLDVILDDNFTPDGLPEVNSAYTIRGYVGDHPDHNTFNFGFGGDTDVYKVTLQAGQILRLGAMTGNALFASRVLYNANGAFQGGQASDALSLPVRSFDFLSGLPGSADTIDDDYLVKTTGTYYIVIGIGDFTDPGDLADAGIEPGEFGDYQFTVEVFDDGDSGFRGDTNSGDGRDLVTPPAPIAFAGPDQQFGTSDDLSEVVIADFRFTWSIGADNTPETADDLVVGNNGAGIITQRTNFNRITTRVDSSIGTPHHAGVPGDVIESDVDIYHLNQGVAVAPNTRFTVTVKLAEFGADLGSRTQDALVNWNPDVQFGFFETTTSTDVQSAKLVFSPTDFKSSGGQPGVIAQNGPFAYGYNAAGDFFITFVTPGRLGVANAVPASYAFYIQGVFNTDYALEVVQEGTAGYVRPKQNFFIETRGGTAAWIDASGLTTRINSFNAAALGFTGAISGQTAHAYILSNLVANLTAMFDAAGVDAVFSTNPAAFEFEDFSTIFVSTSNDPTHFLSERNYGISEHSDPFNADRNDEAAVFLPSFSALGFTPSQADADDFVDSLSAAIARRAGELLGLRMTNDSTSFGGDPMAGNSPELFGGQAFSFTAGNRPLSGLFDSDVESNFFLGQQSAVPLMNKIVRP